MGLQIIIGNSGSGKSTFMYKDMINCSEADNKRKYLLIVPEQFTMETQRKIVNLTPNRGTMYIDILSFERLAKRIFDEAGLSTIQVLDDMGKCLILRKIVDENKEKLSVFGSKVKMAGFIDEIKSLVSELYQYGVGENELKLILEKSEKKPLLHSKFSDIMIIFEKLNEYLKDRFVMNEELLTKACLYMQNSSIIRDSYIIFDEYTGFSPVQYQVITILLQYASKVSVSVTMRDYDETQNSDNFESNPFSLSIKTIRNLKKTADAAGVEIYKDIVMNRSVRTGENQVLTYLEQNLFKYRIKPYQYDITKDKESISIHVCNNVISEASYVASKIKHLVEYEKYRYKEIAVVTADITQYYRSFDEVFAKYEIPCFIDYKRSIITNPLVETLRAVLEIMSDNYSYDSVFRFLKSGLSSISSEDIDILENYVIQYGIRGHKKWISGDKSETEEIKKIRENFVSDTEEFYQTVKKARTITVKDAMEAIYSFMVKLSMEEKMQNLQSEFYSKGNIALAKEYGQAYEKVINLLDKAVFLIGDEKVSIKEITAILDSGFEEIKVGVVPPTLDRVVIGDIERTRLSDIKVMFLIGVNDGLIPKIAGKGGVLTQNERKFLAEQSVELSPTARENSFIQKYYLYLILTKMSERLYVSFKRTSSDGSSSRPSYIINQLLRMYKGIQVIDENINHDRGLNVLDIVNDKTAYEYLASNIYDYIEKNMPAKDLDDFKQVYSIMEKRDKTAVSDIMDAALYENKVDSIDGAVARAIYGTNLQNSVSRLETFASCAYKHFISYGLMLMPRKEYEVASTDIGSIYHKTMELFSKKIYERKMSWSKVDDELRNKLVDEAVNEAVEKLENSAILDSYRNMYEIERIRKMSKKTAWALSEQLKSGMFEPGEFELRFSSDYGLNELKYYYDEGSQMTVKGVIDRVDYYHDGDDIYIKIIDYKSGKKKFEINDVYNGLQLQLVLYLEAAALMAKKKYPGKNIKPAGMFYYSIDNPVVNSEDVIEPQEMADIDKPEVKSSIIERVNSKILKNLRIDGIVNDSEESLKAFEKDIDDIRSTGGESSVIPVSFAKNGRFSSRSNNVSESDFEALIKFVHEKIGQLGQDILNGDISLNPYQQVGTTGTSASSNACEYCEFKTICGFDTKISGCEYRSLYKLKSSDIWTRIRQEGGKENGQMD